MNTTWTCLGDAWARPRFHQIMRAAQQALAAPVPNGRGALPITLNDFSNMNGGYFPPHDFHNQGRHVDGLIDGYATKDAALARKMVEVANEIYAAMTAAGGFTTFQILVDFRRANSNDPFTRELALHAVGGQPALHFFRDGGAGHRGHFHVQMR